MARNRRTWAITACALTVALIAFAARWFLAGASVFARYDDEGFVMLMLREYLAGDVIYSGFYAQYGPFAYQVLALVHRGLDLIPSNDSARISSLLLHSLTFCSWTGIALWLFRSPSVVILFALGLGQHLMAATVEPGHPQDTGALLISLFAAAVLAQRANSSNRVGSLAAVFGGFVVGGLLLTKLNLGFLVGIAFLFQAPPARFAWRIWRFGILLLPLLLMWQRLGDDWVGNFWAAETVGLLLFLGASLDPSQGEEKPALPWLVGVTAATSLILAVELLHGALPRDLADGIVFQHLDFPSRVTQPGFFPAETRQAVAISFILFLFLRLIERRPWSQSVADAAKLIVAAAGLAYAIGFGVDYLVAYGLPFVWLLKSRRVEHGSMTFLAALALILPLQGFPVAGTQIYLGAIPLTFLCALTFDDIVAEFHSSIIPGALALLAVLGLAYQLGALKKVSDHYAELTPLALPGASYLRLPPQEVDEYRTLTKEMRRFDTFVSQPGLLSLHLWTEIAPPTKWNAGAWMQLISTQRQREIVAALRRARHPGAAIDSARATFWTEGQRDLHSPLAGYLESECVTVTTAGDWQVRDCRRRQDPRADAQ